MRRARLQEPGIKRMGADEMNEPMFLKIGKLVIDLKKCICVDKIEHGDEMFKKVSFRVTVYNCGRIEYETFQAIRYGTDISDMKDVADDLVEVERLFTDLQDKIKEHGLKYEELGRNPKVECETCQEAVTSKNDGVERIDCKIDKMEMDSCGPFARAFNFWRPKK
jgi:hypothetical protein